MIEAELDDGRILEFPDGTDPAVIQSTVQKLLGSQPKSQQELYKENMDRYNQQRAGMSNAEIIASDPAYRAIKGAAAPLEGTAQWLSRNVLDPGGGLGLSDFVGKQLNTGESLRRSGMEKKGEDPNAFDPYNLAGAIATGGVAMKGAPVAKSLLDKILQGGSVSGLYSSSMPVLGDKTDDEFNKAKLQQMITGSTVGAAVPLVGAGVGGAGKLIGQLVRPTNKEGIKRDIIDLLVNKLGKQGAKDTGQALKLDKGRSRTAGEAIANQTKGTGDDYGKAVTVLEKDLARQMPHGQKITESYKAGEMERKAIIDKIAGTEDDMTSAIAKRAKVTDPLFEAVGRSDARIDATPVINKIDDIIAKNVNEKDITVPLRYLRSRILPKGGSVPKGGDPNLPATLRYQAGIPDEFSNIEQNPQNLSSLSKAIGKMINQKTPGGQPQYDVKALDDIKKLLDKRIGLNEPAYSFARQDFKALSQPINRMELGRVLSEKLTQPTGKEAPGTFIKAVEDAPKTIRAATGFKRGKELGDYLDIDQVKDVNKVAQALETKAHQARMGQGVEPMLKTLESGIEMTIPQLLSRPAMITNAILRGVGANRAPAYHKMAAEIMTDPQLLGVYLRNPPTSATFKIANEIFKDISPIISGQMGGKQ